MRSVSIALGLTIMLFTANAVRAGELDGGGWCGKWTATNKGHEGPLQAKFQEIDACHYRVVFTGKFAKVVPFRFKTTLNVVGHDGDKVILAGEARVAVFGKFSYHAVADAHNFNATYDSRGWQGEFNLSR
jgi:hypothetical protein